VTSFGSSPTALSLKESPNVPDSLASVGIDEARPPEPPPPPSELPDPLLKY
jgi:hypothetical protein